jgi:hypothetical protein
MNEHSTEADNSYLVIIEDPEFELESNMAGKEVCECMFCNFNLHTL